MNAPLRNPNLQAQHEAMSKLAFLIGDWTGFARIHRPSGEIVELKQTEKVQYKLEGLLLLIEGIGWKHLGERPVLQALGLISYEDADAKYQMRAFNDGRFLETEVKLLDDRKGLNWGFALGNVTTKSVLAINENGEWAETHDISIDSQPSRKLMEVAVRLIAPASSPEV